MLLYITVSKMTNGQPQTRYIPVEQLLTIFAANATMANIQEEYINRLNIEQLTFIDNVPEY